MRAGESSPGPVRPAPDRGETLLEGAGKTVLVVRLAALLLALLAGAGTAGTAPGSGSGAWAAGAVTWVVLALALLNAALLLRWARLVPVLRRHPGLLALDVVASLAALSLPGSGALLLYEAAGALLVGMVLPRAGAALLVALLAGGQVLVATRPGVDLGGQVGRGDLGALVVDVVLVALLAGVGTVVRRGHDALVGSLAAVAARDAEAARAAAAARERTRLAREMHDGVAKSLFGMTLTAAALARTTTEPAARALAGELAGCADACGRQVREMLDGLRSDGPAAQDAAPDLDDLVRAWSRATGVAVRTHPPDLRGVAVDPALAGTAAAVLREALDNAARHAGARRVDVTLTGGTDGPGRLDGAGVLTLTVSDDGAGFDTAAPAGGRWGVVGMRERAAEAGGDLAVTSAPGAGTTVRLRLPAVRAGAAA